MIMTGGARLSVRAAQTPDPNQTANERKFDLPQNGAAGAKCGARLPASRLFLTTDEHGISRLERGDRKAPRFSFLAFGIRLSKSPLSPWRGGVQHHRMAAPQRVDASVPANRPESPVKWAFRKALLLSLVAGAVHVFACWYSVAPHGSDFLYQHVSWFVMAYFLVLVLYNVFHLLYSARRKLLGYDQNDPRNLLATVVFLGTLLIITLLAVCVGEGFRYVGYKGIVSRGRPLVAAIKQYQLKQGTPPATLAALVPDYLPAIPGTGVNAYPRYEFITNNSPAKYGGDKWVLTVDVSTDDLTREELVYYPDQNYPSPPQVSMMRRCGDWACLSTARPRESH